MSGNKKYVNAVGQPVYDLVKRFSTLRVEAETLSEDDERNKEIDREMETIALAVMNHLLLNEITVLPS